MNKMKRLFSLALVLAMGMGLVGCSSSANKTNENNPEQGNDALTTLEKAVNQLDKRSSFQYTIKEEGTQFIAEPGNGNVVDIDETDYNYTVEVFNENNGDDYYSFTYYDTDQFKPYIRHDDVDDSLLEELFLLKINGSYEPIAETYYITDFESPNTNLIQPYFDVYNENNDYFKIEQSEGKDNTIIKITCTDTDGYSKAISDNITDIEKAKEIWGYDISKERFKNYTIEFSLDQDLNIVTLKINRVKTFDDLQSEYHQTYIFSDLNEPTFTLEEIKAILTEAKEN